MAQILKIDFDLGLGIVKALKKYNQREIRDFMNGSGVSESPRFSANFEDAITKCDSPKNVI